MIRIAIANVKKYKIIYTPNKLIMKPNLVKIHNGAESGEMKHFSQIIPLSKGNSLITFFEKYAEFKDYNYASALKWLKKWETNDINIEDITEEWALGFKRFLLINMSNNTASLYFAKLRCILNVAVRRGIIGINPLLYVKIPRRQPVVQRMTKKEITRLYSLKYEGTKGEVLKAFILGFETGLSLCDILRLDETNIRDGYIKIARKKTGIIVENKLTDKAIEILKEGIPKIPGTREGVYYHLKPILAEVGYKIRGKAFHLARHEFAVDMLGAGVQIPIVQELMGHSSPLTTMIYAKPTQEMKDKAMDKLNEINR